MKKRIAKVIRVQLSFSGKNMRIFDTRSRSRVGQDLNAKQAYTLMSMYAVKPITDKGWTKFGSEP